QKLPKMMLFLNSCTRKAREMQRRKFVVRSSWFVVVVSPLKIEKIAPSLGNANNFRKKVGAGGAAPCKKSPLLGEGVGGGGKETRLFNLLSC
ncbi:MAG: hypothetical protein II916_05590, partial [Oscillospiraceae bacterium]|nr:hypothetical protein [Oscillospiraceae bacterium]